MARNKYPEVTRGRILEAATKLFLEKGYEHTTIQNLIDALGDLSKGAIYHHYKCKEDIVEAVLDNLHSHVDAQYEEIKSSKELSGLEKLNVLFHFSIGNSSQGIIMQALPNLLKNPKFLAKQLDTTINKLVPEMITPIILDGVADGSIVTDYPEELAEVLSLLANVWLNPLIFDVPLEKIRRKCLFFRQILVEMGIDIIDDKLMEEIENLGVECSSAVVE